MLSSRNNNFNHIRLIAALLVVVSHGALIAKEPDRIEPFLEFSTGNATLGQMSVIAFFVISGLLIAKSADECEHWWQYFAKRALRILPGLWFSLFVTAFAIGPLMTDLNLTEYIGSPTTFRYLQSGFLRLSNELPGVFSQSRLPLAVNWPLWSVRVESLLYGCLAAVYVLSPRRWRRLSATLMWFATIWAVHAGLTGLSGKFSMVALLVRWGAYFWIGTVAYEFRSRMVLSIPLALAGLALWVVLHAGGSLFAECTSVLFGYSILVFGLHPALHLPPLPGKADLSYGVYLFGFPLQQTVESLWHFSWLWNVVVSCWLAISMAALSWNFVERPALNLKPSGRHSA